MIERAYIFNAVREMLGRGFSAAEVRKLDKAIDCAAGIADEALRTSDRGIAIIHSFEGCKLTAYPDPGTGGKPWTIGWGSTTDENGQPIPPGTVWTQERADSRFKAHLAKFEDGVHAALDGAPTTQNQFDALVSLSYNIGTQALAESTLMRLHRLGQYDGAAEQFHKWVNAGGKRMAGLVRRRAAEAKLYRGIS